MSFKNVFSIQFLRGFVRSKDLSLAIGLLAVAVLSRWIPHPPNMSAMGAVALQGGILLAGSGTAFGLPILALLISDSVLGFHSSTGAVYLGFFVAVLLGRYLRRQSHLRYHQILATGFVSSLIFFVITNLMVWLHGALYPSNFTGLMECFAMAIPFFSNQILGDLLWNSILVAVFSPAFRALALNRVAKS